MINTTDGTWQPLKTNYTIKFKKYFPFMQFFNRIIFNRHTNNAFPLADASIKFNLIGRIFLKTNK